jgi:hypothetical protein
MNIEILSRMIIALGLIASGWAGYRIFLAA